MASRDLRVLYFDGSSAAKIADSGVNGHSRYIDLWKGNTREQTDGAPENSRLMQMGEGIWY